MSNTTLVPVILCGGRGERLWPRSRTARPKPFLPLLGDRTLFAQTMSRFADDSRFAPPIVVTGAQLVEQVEEVLGEWASAQIIVEPDAKNTAAAIALAANLLPPEAVMLVCPSDHHIQDSEAFIEAAFEA